MKDRIVLLLVDDEPELRDVVAEWLQSDGFEVVTAGGGNEAFELFVKSGFDAVITDIRMPEGDGADLIMRIRSKDKKIPVIVVTGFTDYEKADLLRMGANTVFNKPFDLKILVDQVNQLIKAKESTP